MNNLQIHSDDIHRELNSKFGTKLPLLISAKDLNGNVVFANDHFDILEGPSFQGFIGKNIFDLFPFEVANELWMNDVAAIEGNCVIKKIEQVKHSDGKLNDYLTLKMPLVNSRSSAVGTVAFSINTSTSSLELLKNNNVDTDLSNAIKALKHELIAPLNVINGFSQLLRKEISHYQNKALNNMVQNILDACEHMNGLIQGSGSSSHTPSDIFELTDICQQCKDWLDGMALEHAKSITFCNTASNTTIASSKLGIRQVILNFLTNGIKYSQGNHPINMMLSMLDEETIRLEISSTGKQLTIEEQSQIFDRDFRLKNLNKVKGQGLGLSIVKQTLESLGCDMGVTSDDSGITTFWFHIKAYTRLHS